MITALNEDDSNDLASLLIALNGSRELANPSTEGAARLKARLNRWAKYFGALASAELAMEIDKVKTQDQQQRAMLHQSYNGGASNAGVPVNAQQAPPLY